MGRSVSFVFTLGFFVFTWMVYDNVYSDLDTIKALAESIACTARDCEKHHVLTRYDRYFFGQSFEFTWDHSKQPVVVACSRSLLAIGERQCHTQ